MRVLKILFYSLLALLLAFFAFGMLFAAVWGFNPLWLLPGYMFMLFLYGLISLVVWLAANAWKQRNARTISE